MGMLAAGCGGDSKPNGTGNTGSTDTTDAGQPVDGGSITYALEAATTNFCLPKAQLAIAGIIVTQAVYDSLVVPTADGGYEPYLAKTVEHNADYTKWTFTLRDGITFHNGEKLDGDALLLNFKSWRGQNPKIPGISLFPFVFSNIKDVLKTGPMTVEVETVKPWVAFPATVFASGRLGIAAPAQISDDKTCATNMIGTGPFQLDKFEAGGTKIVVKKNAKYWRKGFPHLDQITFQAQTVGQQRITGVEGGQFELGHFSGGLELERLRKLKDAGTIQLYEEPKGRREVGYTLINNQRVPFTIKECREALSKGLDRQKINEVRNAGIPDLASGIFDEKVDGYVPLDDPSIPKFDLTAAKAAAEKCKSQNGGKFGFTLKSTSDPETIQTAQLVKEMGKAFGADITLQTTEQVQIINDALGGDVDAFLWRNHPGYDADTGYVWFYTGSPINFARIDDPALNKLWDDGRSEPDAAKRKAIYEDLNRKMNEGYYNLLSWYTPWSFGMSEKLNGLLGPNLPDETGAEGTKKPVESVGGYHQLLGLWLEK